LFVWNKEKRGKKNTAQKSSCRHQQRTYFVGVRISFLFVFLLPNQHLLIEWGLHSQHWSNGVWGLSWT
jgi:hypothetical protein